MSDVLNAATDDARLERIASAFSYVPLGLYDEVTKLAESALGEFIKERDVLRARVVAAERERDALIAEKQRWLTEGFLGPEDVARAQARVVSAERERDAAREERDDVRIDLKAVTQQLRESVAWRDKLIEAKPHIYHNVPGEPIGHDGWECDPDCAACHFAARLREVEAAVRAGGNAADALRDIDHVSSLLKDQVEDVDNEAALAEIVGEHPGWYELAVRDWIHDRAREALAVLEPATSNEDGPPWEFETPASETWSLRELVEFAESMDGAELRAWLVSQDADGTPGSERAAYIVHHVLAAREALPPGS